MENTVQDASVVGADDDARMEVLMQAYEAPLLRYATRLLGNPAAAQDVVQTALIRFVGHWQGDWQPSDALKNWLYRVTHNEAVNHIRRESRRQDLHEKAAAEQVITAGEGTDSTAERQALVLSLLHKLKPHERQVVLLRLQEGLSYAQIADVTGRSQGNVGNILHHAVIRLADGLAKAKAGGLL